MLFAITSNRIQNIMNPEYKIIFHWEKDVLKGQKIGVQFE